MELNELARKFQAVDGQIGRTAKIPLGFIPKNAHGENKKTQPAFLCFQKIYINQKPSTY